MMVLRFSPVSSGLFSLKMPNTRSARGMQGIIPRLKQGCGIAEARVEHRDQAVAGEC